MMRLAVLFAGVVTAVQFKQPIIEAGAPSNDAQFGVSAQSDKPGRPPAYRSAWDDCGGVGASKTEKMRAIASKIKGWAAPVKFIRNAAQDCNMDHATTTGPGSGVVYPGQKVWTAAKDGLNVAAKALGK